MDLFDSQQQQRPGFGPMQRGAVTAGHYVPTTEEKSVIQKANHAFRSFYISGISAGVGLGFLVAQHRRQPLTTLPGVFLMAACALTGEYGGRIMGKREAKRILAAELSPDSELRRLMQNSNNLDPTSSSSPSPSLSTHNHSLEGSVIDPPPSLFSSLPSSQPTSSRQPYIPPQHDTAWDSIRRQNSAGPSSWELLRR
ncbi:hypothetical protein HK097_002281, partial [Rhizophlyctis rosea]